MKRDTQRTGVFTRRALLIGGAQIAALGALGAKLYEVQVVEGARYATLAETNRVSARLIAPPRGRLLDRTGTPVAGNRLNWRALLIAEQTGDVSATLENFSRIVPLAEARGDMADMRTVVIVGSSRTRLIERPGTPWLYTPRSVA